MSSCFRSSSTWPNLTLVLSQFGFYHLSKNTDIVFGIFLIAFDLVLSCFDLIVTPSCLILSMYFYKNFSLYIAADSTYANNHVSSSFLRFTRIVTKISFKIEQSGRRKGFSLTISNKIRLVLFLSKYRRSVLRGKEETSSDQTARLNLVAKAGPKRI